MPNTRLFVMRHGQSEGNVGRIWTSARHGFPLTELGREQVRQAARSLQGSDVTTVYGSPLVRAQQSAAEVADVLGLGWRVLEGVEEIHVGVHEGRHDDEVGPVAMEVFGRWLVHGDLDHGFEAGETGREIAQRFGGALEAVSDQHSGRSVAVVSHGGAIALGLAVLCDNLPVEWVGSHLLGNAEVVEVVRSDAGWHCASWAGLVPGDG